MKDVVPAREYEDLAEQLTSGELPDDLLPDLPEEPTYVPNKRLRFKQSRHTTTEKKKSTLPSSDSTTEDVNDYGVSNPNHDDEQPTGAEPDVMGNLRSTSTGSTTKVDVGRAPDAADPTYTRPEADLQEPRCEAKRQKKSVEDSEDPMFTCLQECEEAFMMHVDLGFISHRQLKKFLRAPAAYLVAKMRNCEVHFERLPRGHKALFTRAKTKEATSFIKQEAVRRRKDLAEEKLGREAGRLMR